MPCGIYDDEMRIGMIKEHFATIEKAMNQIKELEKEGDKNYNQLVRWIVTKENHASELQEIVSQYFMTQRIKPDAKDYGKKLGLLHEMMIYSMKCKQTTDLTYVSKLRDLVKEFQGLYFEKQ
jgi:nickel superoxide dismutase